MIINFHLDNDNWFLLIIFYYLIQLNCKLLYIKILSLNLYIFIVKEVSEKYIDF